MNEAAATETNKGMSNKVGAIGMFLSIGCAIHCMVTPIFISVLPMLNIEFLHNPIIEFSLLISGFIMSGSVVGLDYKRHHHSKAILAIVLAGFAFLFSAAFFHDHQMDLYLSIPGATLVIIGLYKNYKASHKH